MKVPFSSSYWVVPGLFLAGELPSMPSEEGTKRKIRALYDIGIRCIINLMEHQERDHDGEHFFPYEAWFREFAKNDGVEVECCRFPIRDLGIPSTELMEKIQEKLDVCLEKKIPVYLHCWGGIGRTGMAVGVYLIRHHISRGEEVFGHIAQLRRDDPKCVFDSPETSQQRQFVLAWKNKT